MTAVILAAGVSSSCGSQQGSRCSVDGDCFRGESCVDGRCESDRDATTQNNVVLNNGQSANNGNTPNNDTTPNNQPLSNNATGSNNSTDPDNNTGGSNNSSVVTGECLVDPFTASCSVPDDNDSFTDYIMIDSDCGGENCGPPGCSGSDDFTGGSARIESMQLCALEDRDRYSTNLIPCDNKRFVIEATLTPHQDCDPDLYVFNMTTQGFDCTMPEDRVRCEVLPDGSKKITAFVEPSISIAVANFLVEKHGVDNAHFDYDIDILVRE